MKKIKGLGISAIFPGHCAYCDCLIPGDRLVCKECEGSMPVIEDPVCTLCGRGKQFCDCGGKDSYFESVAAPFYFEGNVRKGLHTYKFRNSPSSSDAYAIETAKTIGRRYGNIKFDFITEVPMSKRGKRDRGYNQSAILAEKTGRLAGIEYKPGVLCKIYETEKQHGLPAYLRRGNLTGVFDVPDPGAVRGKTILLCDDISTSGETLNECAKMLWLEGADKVYAITLALTKSKKKLKR